MQLRELIPLLMRCPAAEHLESAGRPARVLAKAGAEVTIAARHVESGADAAQRIRDEFPGATPHVSSLDLADLASVRRFATDWTVMFIVPRKAICAGPFLARQPAAAIAE